MNNKILNEKIYIINLQDNFLEYFLNIMLNDINCSEFDLFYLTDL
jgi:hypothetical protein